MLLASTEVDLPSAAADQLASLGVTQLTILRDEGGSAVLLEGWAFDPAASEKAACDALGVHEDSRILRPVAHVSVASPMPSPKRQ